MITKEIIKELFDYRSDGTFLVKVKKLKNYSVILLCLTSLTGCKHITITDSIWYGSLGSQGAVLEHTLTSTQTTLTLEQFAELWDNLSDPLICTNSSVFATWKANLEKLCSDSNSCSYNDTQAVSSVAKAIGSVLKKQSDAIKRLNR
jgi:hypothetical protein